MMSSHRQVQVGRTYSLPPQLFGVPPNATSSSLEQWRDAVVGAAALAAAAAAQHQAAKRRRTATAEPSPLQQHEQRGEGDVMLPANDSGEGADGAGGRLLDGFIRAFHGVSPALVAELCSTVGVTPESSPIGLSVAQWEALYGRWMEWMERLHSGDFAATSDPETGR